MDGEHGLSPRHHRRSGRGPAHGQGDAVAIARACDGSADHGGPVRQRLRVRVPEQSLLVFADDAACPPRRTRASPSSGCSAMAAARPTARPSYGRAQACSIGFVRTSRDFRGSSGPSDRTKVSIISTPFAKWSAAFRRPRRKPPIRSFPTSIARSAFPPPMRITRG